MNKIKVKKYYLSRFLGWTVVNPLFLILTLINCLFAKYHIYIGLIIIILFILIIINFIFFYFNLDNIFFKPYKHISIIPNFSKVTFGFALITYLKISGIILSIYSMPFLLYEITSIRIVINNIMGEACIAFFILHIFFVTLISPFIALFIIHRIVKKNATIETKTQV